MSDVEFTSPVVDSVPKVSNEIAVGENLEFQRKWWAFERIVWGCFGLVLLLALLGVFGRGWVATAKRTSSDGSLTLKFDRIQRTGTPSDLTILFGPNAIRGGYIRIYVSESLISKLGAQRISPQPEKSILGNDGVTYVFAAEGRPAAVVVALQPSGPGRYPFRVALPDSGSTLDGNVVVVP